jgi:hypothetical protein
LLNRLIRTFQSAELVRPKLLIAVIAVSIFGCTPSDYLDDPSKPDQPAETSQGDSGLEYDRRSEVRSVPWNKSNDMVRDIGGHAGYVMPAPNTPPNSVPHQ